VLKLGCLGPKGRKMAAKKWVFCKECNEVAFLCNGTDRHEIPARNVHRCALYGTLTYCTVVLYCHVVCFYFTLMFFCFVCCKYCISFSAGYDPVKSESESTFKLSNDGHF